MALGRKTGGRQSGTPNRATAEIKDLAQKHGPAVIEELARLALNSESERTRVAAGAELLDRGYGRPHQSMDVTTDQTHRHVQEMSEEELTEAIRAGLPHA